MNYLEFIEGEQYNSLSIPKKLEVNVTVLGQLLEKMETVNNQSIIYVALNLAVKKISKTIISLIKDRNLEIRLEIEHAKNGNLNLSNKEKRKLYQEIINNNDKTELFKTYSMDATEFCIELQNDMFKSIKI